WSRAGCDCRVNVSTGTFNGLDYHVQLVDEQPDYLDYDAYEIKFCYHLTMCTSHILNEFDQRSIERILTDQENHWLRSSGLSSSSSSSSELIDLNDRMTRSFNTGLCRDYDHPIDADEFYKWPNYELQEYTYLINQTDDLGYYYTNW